MPQEEIFENELGYNKVVISKYTTAFNTILDELDSILHRDRDEEIWESRPLGWALAWIDTFIPEAVTTEMRNVVCQQLSEEMQEFEFRHKRWLKRINYYPFAVSTPATHFDVQRFILSQLTHPTAGLRQAMMNACVIAGGEIPLDFEKFDNYVSFNLEVMHAGAEPFAILALAQQVPVHLKKTALDRWLTLYTGSTEYPLLQELHESGACENPFQFVFLEAERQITKHLSIKESENTNLAGQIISANYLQWRLDSHPLSQGMFYLQNRVNST